MRNFIVLIFLSTVFVVSCKKNGSRIDTKEDKDSKVPTSKPEPMTNIVPFGVNLAGAEFGSTFPGTYGADYRYPTLAELDYFKSKGLKLIRLPFKWERIQTILGGPLNKEELDRIVSFVDAARDKGLWVILDLHNYGRRNINSVTHIIGSEAVSVNDVKNVWAEIADTFKSKQNIWGYGIMNEPHSMLNTPSWFDIAQEIIKGIRSKDQSTSIIVGGDSWSSADRWVKSSDNLKNLIDPSDKLIFEAHVYFDNNASGVYKGSYDVEKATPNIGVERVSKFVNWLKDNNLKGFIGEYGIPNDDARWLIVLDNFLNYLRSNCVNGTYWAAGPSWGSYRLSVEPQGGVDKSQMKILEKYKGLDSLNCK